jgi:hypothetical protein
MRLTETQKRYVKRRMDEMAVGHGMVKAGAAGRMIDGEEEANLLRLAFRFYRVVSGGESFLVPEGSREWYRCFHCPDKCEDYRRLAAEEDREADPYGNMPERCPKGDHYMPEMTCTRCGVQYQGRVPAEEGDFLPLCPDCDGTVGDEVRMLRQLIA